MLEIKRRRVGSGKTVHQRIRARRFRRRLLVAMLLLFLLVIAAALLYTWYIGQHPAPNALSEAPSVQTAPKIKAPTPNQNDTVGIVEQSFTGSVNAPANAYMAIKTNPKAACQISVKVNEIPLSDSGLIPKIADDYGFVSWSWRVAKTMPSGNWPVEITCANEALHSAFYRAYLVVKTGL